MRNLYKVLGIASKADDQRIKSAFRRRAKAVHPDLNPGNNRAEACFIELVQAYEVLRDASARASYDGYLAKRRSEARRRFAHCAGLMTASFVLTAASALFVMGMAGANVPYRESWQLAMAALSPAMAGAPATAPQPSDAARDAGWTTRVVAAPVRASTSPATSQGLARRMEPAQSAKSEHRRPTAVTFRSAQRRHLAAAPKPVPAKVAHQTPAAYRSQEDWWPWPDSASDSPRYSLGASELH